jgi:hypothetical protein
MVKLNEKQLGEVKDLLEDYQTICDMLSDCERSIFRLYLMSEKDESDTAEVEISRKGAKTLLQAEKEWTAANLAQLGIEV